MAQSTVTFIVAIVFCTAVQSDHAVKINRPKYISELYADYMKTEERLWHRIELESNENNDTIADVINSHRNIFYDDTFESNSYWRSYLIFGIENLRDQLSNINNTLEENYSFLFDETDKLIYDSSKIDEWARPTMFRRLKENSDGLMDTTVERKNIILHHIQTVSAFLFFVLLLVFNFFHKPNDKQKSIK